MYHDPVLSDLTAPYIYSVIADLKANYHPFYTLFIHAPLCMVSINLVYDFRTKRGFGENDPDPLCPFSSRDFMHRSSAFHKNDCFTVTLDEGFVVGTEDHFTAEIVEFFYTEFLRIECRKSLMRNRMLILFDRHAELCRLSQSEYSEVNAILRQLNEEIVKGLKPLTVLKKARYERR